MRPCRGTLCRRRRWSRVREFRSQIVASACRATHTAAQLLGGEAQVLGGGRARRPRSGPGSADHSAQRCVRPPRMEGDDGRTM